MNGRAIERILRKMAFQQSQKELRKRIEEELKEMEKMSKVLGYDINKYMYMCYEIGDRISKEIKSQYRISGGVQIEEKRLVFTLSKSKGFKDLDYIIINIDKNKTLEDYYLEVKTWAINKIGSQSIISKIRKRVI